MDPEGPNSMYFQHLYIGDIPGRYVSCLPEGTTPCLQSNSQGNSIHFKAFGRFLLYLRLFIWKPLRMAEWQLYSYCEKNRGESY